MKKFLILLSLLVTVSSHAMDKIGKYFLKASDVKRHCEGRLQKLEEKLVMPEAGSMREENMCIEKAKTYLAQDIFTTDNYISSIDYWTHIHGYFTILEVFIIGAETLPLDSIRLDKAPENKIAVAQIAKLPRHFIARYKQVKKLQLTAEIKIDAQTPQKKEQDTPVTQPEQKTENKPSVENKQTPDALIKPSFVDYRKLILFGGTGMTLFGGLCCILYGKKDAIIQRLRSSKYMIPFQKKDTLK